MVVSTMDLRRREETNEAIAVYTYGHFVRARNINSTRQGAPNLPGARTHFATPGQARETTICVGSALATSVRAGVGRCFDGEAEQRCSETIQTGPFHPPAGAIDAFAARECWPGAGEPQAWMN